MASISMKTAVEIDRIAMYRNIFHKSPKYKHSTTNDRGNPLILPSGCFARLAVSGESICRRMRMDLSQYPERVNGSGPCNGRGPQGRLCEAAACRFRTAAEMAKRRTGPRRQHN